MDIRDSYIQAIRDQEIKKEKREDQLTAILDKLIETDNEFNKLKKIEENNSKIEDFEKRIKELEG